MQGFQIPDGYLDFADSVFYCPDCNKLHSDENDKYTKRINKNKSWSARIKCTCNTTFYLTVSTEGDFVTYKK